MVRCEEWLNPCVNKLPASFVFQRCERFCDGWWSRGAGIHRLQIFSQPGGLIQHACFVCPVQCVGGVEIGHRDMVADNELASVHVLLEHGEHFNAFFPREIHILRQALFLRINGGVSRDAPQRLFDLCYQKENPSVHLRAIFQRSWDESCLGMFVGEVKLDRR